MTEETKTKGKRGGARPGAGREGGYRMPERMREKIKVGVILARAQQIADGKLVIIDPQVESVRRAYAQMLLNKALPDLTRTELAGDPDQPLVITTRAL